MSGDRVERRLAAVLAADVAGYSRLMGRDEERTLADLKNTRQTVNAGLNFLTGSGDFAVVSQGVA